MTVDDREIEHGMRVVGSTVVTTQRNHNQTHKEVGHE